MPWAPGAVASISTVAVIVCRLPAAEPLSVPVVVTSTALVRPPVKVRPAVAAVAASAIRMYRRRAEIPVWPYIVKVIAEARVLVLETMLSVPLS